MFTGVPALCLALIAGCAFPLSLAPFGLWYMGLLSMVALLATIDGIAPRQALLRGYLYGVGLYAVGVSWIYVSIHVHGGASPPLATFLVVLFVLFMGVFPALQCYVQARWFSADDTSLVWVFPALWVLQEWVRNWLFSGFPWLLAGYAYLEHPLVHWAPLFGVLGLGTIAAFSAAALFVALRRLVLDPGRPRRVPYAQLALLLLFWPGSYLVGLARWVEPTATTLRVAAIQANVDQEEKWKPSMRGPLQALYRNYTLALADRDLIVWPEAAITLPLEAAGPFLDPLARWARERRITLVTGILSRDGQSGAYRNSVVALGAGEGIYHKRALVPFGEYVPLESLLRGLIGFFDLPMSHTVTGADLQPGLRAGDLRLSTSVCYEVVYPELVRMAVVHPDLLLTVSNDTWFGASIGPLQHMQMARMRAVENGRALVRATNNGVSALVDSDGRITATIPQFTRGVLTGEVRIMHGETPFSRWGSWPVVAACFCALGAGALRRRSISARRAMG